jgi:hypothetical protein
MAYANEFLDLLDQVIRRRTEAIRRLVISEQGQGAPKQFNKSIRNKLRTKLLDSASKILVREKAHRAFNKLVVRKKLRHITGYGIDGRFDHIYEWARGKFRGPIVYVFWNGKKCLYVGKGQSYKRLKHYKKSYYLKAAESLEVWLITTKSRLASAECLAIHLFDPQDNEKKAAKVKWGKKCPVCKRHDKLKDELDSLLSLKA